MKCPPLDQPAFLAGGDVSLGDAAELELHFPTCSTCRRTLLELRDTMTWMRRAAEPARSESNVPPLRARIAHSNEKRQPLAGWWARLVLWFQPRFSVPGPTPRGWQGRAAGALAAATVLALVNLLPVEHGGGARTTGVIKRIAHDDMVPMGSDNTTSDDTTLAEGDSGDGDPWAGIDPEALFGQRP